jgi:hypothetical protein
MVRLVQILDSLLSERLESLQKTSDFETGLLLAQTGSQCDTVLCFVPTPSSDDEAGGAAVSVDSSWMVTHAEAVAHMLPGGVAVIGAYLFSPSGKFSALEAKMRPVLSAALRQLRGVEEAQALLLLLPSDARKASARVFAASSTSLKPLELKTTSMPPQVRLPPRCRAPALPTACTRLRAPARIAAADRRHIAARRARSCTVSRRRGALTPSYGSARRARAARSSRS